MNHRILTFGGVALALLIISGIASGQESETLPIDTSNQDGGPFWLPYGASSYTAEIDGLYNFIFWVTMGMFILVEGLIIIFCILYRRRPGHRPAYIHGNNTAELIWTIVPGIFFLGLAIFQIGTWNKIKLDFPDPTKPNVTEVDVLGHQYKWGIRYPGSKKTAFAQLKKQDPDSYDEAKDELGKDELKYDISNLGNFHMPFGNKALVNIRSMDVIHSFFIPHMRVKQDTVPGIRQRIWFWPNRIQLIDLKAPTSVDGEYQVREEDTWVMKPRIVQPFVWVNDPKDFEQGGPYYEKKIAVSAGENYSMENGGFYAPFKAVDVEHKVRVLYQGKIEMVEDDQGYLEAKKYAWSECDYALGFYEIACAELCGMGHYTMRGFLIVEPKASYDWWYGKSAWDAFEGGEPFYIWKNWKD